MARKVVLGILIATGGVIAALALLGLDVTGLAADLLTPAEPGIAIRAKIENGSPSISPPFVLLGPTAAVEVAAQPPGATSVVILRDAECGEVSLSDTESGKTYGVFSPDASSTGVVGDITIYWDGPREPDGWYGMVYADSLRYKPRRWYAGGGAWPLADKSSD